MSSFDTTVTTGYINRGMNKKVLIMSVILSIVIASAAIAGEVLINPDPFDPARGSTRISYNLEKASDIAIYIFGPEGRLLMKKDCNAGSKGGQEGLNQVEWSGKSEYGDTAASGNYMVRVVEMDDMKVIGSSHLSVAEGYVSKRVNPLKALAVLLLVMTGLVAANGTLRLYGLVKPLDRTRGKHKKK